MTQSSFEAVFSDGARALYRQLSSTEQEEVQRIRELIERDPYPDGQLKTAAEVPPVTIYRDARWWLLYEIVEPGHLLIDGIAPAFSPPWWAPHQ